jgi:hypothetical protein
LVGQTADAGPDSGPDLSVLMLRILAFHGIASSDQQKNQMAAKLRQA